MPTHRTGGYTQTRNGRTVHVGAYTAGHKAGSGRHSAGRSSVDLNAAQLAGALGTAAVSVVYLLTAVMQLTSAILTVVAAIVAGLAGLAGRRYASKRRRTRSSSSKRSSSKRRSRRPLVSVQLGRKRRRPRTGPWRRRHPHLTRAGKATGRASWRATKATGRVAGRGAVAAGRASWRGASRAGRAGLEAYRNRRQTQTGRAAADTATRP